MRHTSVFYKDNEISIHNNILGVESVRYNGEKMTSKFSILGATHKFSVYEDEEDVDYTVEIGMSMMGVSISIWRNDEAIILGRCASYRPRPKSKYNREFV